MFLSARSATVIVLGVFTWGCGSDAPKANKTGEARYALVANLEKSAFIGAWDGVVPGDYVNTDAFEVGSYAYLFADSGNVIVPQNSSSDTVLRFALDERGQLEKQGELTAPAGSTPSAVVFASADKAYVSCPTSGKVLAFNPTTMKKLKELDFLGPDYVIAEPGSDDQNPEPGMLGLRDGKLYVGLAQQGSMVTSHDGVQIAVVDVETDEIEKVFSDERGLAESGGEIDRIYLDENEDLYVYAGASYGFVPSQAHGFLRIRKGETEFDPDYYFDVKALELDVPGGHVDYLNHLIWAGDGMVYAAADVPALASNPPDYVNDHTFRVVAIDLYAQKVEVLPLPASNGYSGSLATEGDTLLAGLATESGVGIYTYDLKSHRASDGPAVTTQGYVSQLVPLR